MTLIIKKSTPAEAYKIYRIGEVVVFADYDVHVDTSMDVSSFPKYQGYTIIDPEENVQTTDLHPCVDIQTG